MKPKPLRKVRAWVIVSPEGEITNISLSNEFKDAAHDGWKTFRVKVSFPPNKRRGRR